MLAVHRIVSLSLRTKTFVIVTTTLVSLIIVLYVISRSILFESFNQLEIAETRNHILRVQSAPQGELAYLESVVDFRSTWRRARPRLWRSFQLLPEI